MGVFFRIRLAVTRILQTFRIIMEKFEILLRGSTLKVGHRHGVSQFCVFIQTERSLKSDIVVSFQFSVENKGYSRWMVFCLSLETQKRNNWCQKCEVSAQQAHLNY